MVRIIIECEDYWVDASLKNLANHVENSDILNPVYNQGKKKNYKDDHCKAKIEYIQDKT